MYSSRCRDREYAINGTTPSAESLNLHQLLLVYEVIENGNQVLEKYIIGPQRDPNPPPQVKGLELECPVGTFYSNYVEDPKAKLEAEIAEKQFLLAQICMQEEAEKEKLRKYKEEQEERNRRAEIDKIKKYEELIRQTQYKSCQVKEDLNAVAAKEAALEDKERKMQLGLGLESGDPMGGEDVLDCARGELVARKSSIVEQSDLLLETRQKIQRMRDKEDSIKVKLDGLRKGLSGQAMMLSNVEARRKRVIKEDTQRINEANEKLDKKCEDLLRFEKDLEDLEDLSLTGMDDKSEEELAEKLVTAENNSYILLDDDKLLLEMEAEDSVNKRHLDVKIQYLEINKKVVAREEKAFEDTVKIREEELTQLKAVVNTTSQDNLMFSSIHEEAEFDFGFLYEFKELLTMENSEI